MSIENGCAVCPRLNTWSFTSLMRSSRMERTKDSHLAALVVDATLFMNTSSIECVADLAFAEWLAIDMI